MLCCQTGSLTTFNIHFKIKDHRHELSQQSQALGVRWGGTDHVLVEGSVSLAARQREDGGRGQRAEVPQRQRRTSTTQLQNKNSHDQRSVTRSQRLLGFLFTIQSESVVTQLIHFPY